MQPTRSPKMSSSVVTKRFLNIAHRGARSLAPENTLAAACKALEVGADMWEFDVQMTADGEPIVVHDTTLKRTSNVKDIFPRRRPWRVHQFTLDEIRQLDFGSWFVEQDPFGRIAAGEVSPADLVSYKRQKAPTLEEALSFTREHGWQANVEIKDLRGKPGNARIVPKVVGLVQRLNMVDTVLISSFNHDYLAQIRATDSHIATGVLISRSPRRPVSLLRQLGAQAYHPPMTSVRLSHMQGLIHLGYRVYVRTVNDRKAMLRLMKGGVSGIFTDFPQVLSSVLNDYLKEKA